MWASQAIALILLLCGSAGAQTVMPAPFQVFLDNSGRIVNGGCIWTYTAGTSTLVTTYTDAGLTTPNANPIKAGSDGRFVAYLTNGASYKFVYENIPCTSISHGTVLKTVDNVRAVPTSDVTSLRQLAEGRLTVTSATPVTTADVSAATALYYTPYSGTRIALYDGTSAWNVRTFAEVTISIAGCTASKPYDVWLYDNAGTVTGEILVWTNGTTRATALTRQDGIYVKSGDPTRRYVGTFYCNASGGQTDDTFAKRYVWNYYNRRPRLLRVLETTDSWTYGIAAYRQANGSTANQVDIIVGVAEVSLDLSLTVLYGHSAGGQAATVSIGEDSTTTPLAGVNGGSVVNANGTQFALIQAAVRHYPAVGRHFYAWLEFTSATGVHTFLGDSAGNPPVHSGLIGTTEG